MWLNSVEFFEFAIGLDWPTPETANLWWDFIKEYEPQTETTWKSVKSIIYVNWIHVHNPVTGSLMKLWNFEEGNTQILASDGEIIGTTNYRYKLLEAGIYYANVYDENHLDVTYWGGGITPFEYYSS